MDIYDLHSSDSIARKLRRIHFISHANSDSLTDLYHKSPLQDLIQVGLLIDYYWFVRTQVNCVTSERSIDE